MGNRYKAAYYVDYTFGINTFMWELPLWLSGSEKSVTLISFILILIYGFSLVCEVSWLNFIKLNILSLSWKIFDIFASILAFLIACVLSWCQAYPCDSKLAYLKHFLLYWYRFYLVVGENYDFSASFSCDFPGKKICSNICIKYVLSSLCVFSYVLWLGVVRF